MKLCLSLFLVFLAVNILPIHAQSNSVLEEQLEKIGDANNGAQIRSQLLARDPFPRKEFVTALRSPKLSIRTGAIEILEEITGKNHGYDPFLQSEEENIQALKEWDTWATGSESIERVSKKLDQETANQYIQELLSDKRQRYHRAIKRLEPFHLHAVGKIQEFIITNPQLTDGAKAKLTQAQYHLVLIRSNQGDPLALSRDLNFGSREQKLAGITRLKQVGLTSIPIIRNFVEDPDSLIRETAIDSLLDVGGEQVLPIVQPILANESDVNVIHVAIRKLKDIKSKESIKIVSDLISHADEDIVVSAIKIYQQQTGGGNIYGDPFNNSNGNTSGKAADPSTVEKKILSLLDDQRWRVRATALEYITNKKIKVDKSKILSMLEDSDEFVRHHAVKTAISLRLKDAISIFEKQLAKEGELNVSAIEGIIKIQGEPNKKQLALIQSKGTDAVINMLGNLSGKRNQAFIRPFVYSDNKDIAITAIKLFAKDDTIIKRSLVSNMIAEALRSGDPDKITGILSAIDLPSKKNRDRELSTVQTLLIETSSNPELDSIYSLMLKQANQQQLAKLAADAKKTSTNTPTSGVQGYEGLIAAIRDIALKSEDPDHREKAIILLARAGDDQTLEYLAKNILTLPSSQRGATAQALRYTRSKHAIPILKKLLTDPVTLIREKSAAAMFSDDDNITLITTGLNEIADVNSPIQAKDIYTYQLEYAAKKRKAKPLLASWSLAVLQNEESSVDNQVLALILLRSANRPSDIEFIKQKTRSPSPIIRRAAWYTYLKTRQGSLIENPRLMNDESPIVRLAYPLSMNTKGHDAWQHYFSDKDHVEDEYSSYYSSGRNSSLTKQQENNLRTLAESDSSEVIRFESWFTLMTHRKPIDINAFSNLVNKQPKESNVSYRITSFFEDNHRTVGRGLSPLISFVQMKNIDYRKRKPLLDRLFGKEQRFHFTSFQSLAKVAETQDDQPQHEETDEEVITERTELNIVFFHKHGCKDCLRVEKLLENVIPEFEEGTGYKVTIHRYEVTESAVLNQALSSRIDSKAGIAPALFTQAGGLLKNDLQGKRIMDMLSQADQEPINYKWYEVSEEEYTTAQQEVTETFDALTLPIIIIAGLLDGVNPCAFATIIFFLSYLQVAKRTPREIFFVGSAFILAVFLAYLSVGLVFHSIIGKFTETFSAMRVWLNYIFATFALVVAFFSLKDYFVARRGDLKDMTLQLPDFLKNRIRTQIRKSSKATNYVIAAFVSGIIISFLELACTGQVYAPIIYKIQQGNLDAVAYLIIYNVAFILPLVIIFALAMTGMKSSALIDFQKKHTAKIKLITAILFILLACVLIFNDQFTQWFSELSQKLTNQE